MSNLRNLIEEDFEFEDTGSRYLKTREHDSLVLDTEKDIFFWNSKNLAGNAITWLIKVKGMSFNDAKKVKFDQSQSPFRYSIHKTSKGEDVIVLPELVDIFWERGKSKETREYWYRRGITDQTIDRFRLGYNNGWNLIPIFVDGTFRNFQIRRDLPDKRIKSWYRGVGPLLFNSDLLELASSVIITESPTDAILLQQHGFPAVSHTGGAEGWMSKWFIKFLKQNRIFILYDNDSAGKKGAKKVSKYLGLNKCKIYTFDNFPDKYDVGDFFLNGGTVEQLTQLIEEESKYSFEL